MAHDCPETQIAQLAHFQEHGWVRVRKAFDDDAAQGLRDRVWRALAEKGIHKHLPASWVVERPPNLQHLRSDPICLKVGGKSLLAAINTVLGGLPYEQPSDWGSFFLAFPVKTPWHIPTDGWHIDAYYGSPLSPVRGVKIFILFGDVQPRGGGTLMVSGSHRLVHAWFQKNPPPRGTSSSRMRKLLQSNPYVRDLHSPGDVEGRIERLMCNVERVDGIPLKVVEAAGEAGDVFLVHPLILHVASPNSSLAPRFMISGGVTTDMWGWANGPEGHNEAHD